MLQSFFNNWDDDDDEGEEEEKEEVFRCFVSWVTDGQWSDYSTIYVTRVSR